MDMWSEIRGRLMNSQWTERVTNEVAIRARGKGKMTSTGARRRTKLIGNIF
jgi:hypothetical protein